MRASLFWLSFAVAVFPLAAGSARGQAASPQAQGVCPWLTQGTAARVLGSEVSVAVHVSDAGEGWCRFVRVSDSQAWLRIEVGKSVLDRCGAEGTALKGIGNEAVRCKATTPEGGSADRISGRVRSMYFALTQSLPDGAVPGNSPAMLEDALEQAAETVAGNLF